VAGDHIEFPLTRHFPAFNLLPELFTHLLGVGILGDAHVYADFIEAFKITARTAGDLGCQDAIDPFQNATQFCRAHFSTGDIDRPAVAVLDENFSIADLANIMSAI